MLGKRMTSPMEVIKIFNDTLTNEFKIRLMGETELQKEILQGIITLSKTVRLSTLFTTSGLRNIIEILEKDKKLFNFIFDLTDVFTLKISKFDGNDVELELIKRIASAIAYKTDVPTLCLFGKDFSNSFSNVEEIQSTLLNNRWLLSIVLFRFIDGEPVEDLNKNLKKTIPSAIN